MVDKTSNFNPRICVIGLGYVGLPLARLFSTKYRTVGFDLNQAEITREFFLDWEIVKERSEDRLLQLYERERRRNKIPKDEQFSRAYEIRSQRKNNWIFLFSK
ncbi:MAG: hypothetical protein WAO03_08780, partial [Petrimonas mucosa]